jgi:metal-responsive CopG/Arc/MetJ family transcriptional regulator
MFGPRIKLDKPLYDRIRKLAKTAGYSSPDEFVAHVLEKEIAELEKPDSEEEVREKLKGLGYLS